MSNKPGLTWYGRDEPIRVEPRQLIENAALSNCAAMPDTENMLIHGDNLLALKSLEQKYTGRVKRVYIEIMTPSLIQYNERIPRMRDDAKALILSHINASFLREGIISALDTYAPPCYTMRLRLLFPQSVFDIDENSTTSAADLPTHHGTSFLPLDQSYCAKNADALEATL